MSGSEQKVVKEMGKARIVIGDASSEDNQSNDMEISNTGSHDAI